MFFRSLVITFFIPLVSHAHVISATSKPADITPAPIDIKPIDKYVPVETHESVSSPLPPEYVIEEDGSVTLRLCFNWSCASRQTMKFTPEDMAIVKKRMATCPATTLHDRLQRVRIGIWQMELLAEKYQPLLINDLPMNELEEDTLGRTDCIDNSSNTNTYLHILRDIGELPGWTISSPDVRNRLLITVHWTAVMIDADSGLSWSVDSWYRPNGHLPMLMPLQDWFEAKVAWQPPFEELNATPHSIQELCAN